MAFGSVPAGTDSQVPVVFKFLVTEPLSAVILRIHLISFILYFPDVFRETFFKI